MERRNWFISPTIGRGVLNHVLESPTDGGDTGHCGAQGDGSQPGAELLGGVVAVLAAGRVVPGLASRPLLLGTAPWGSGVLRTGSFGMKMKGIFRDEAERLESFGVTVKGREGSWRGERPNHSRRRGVRAVLGRRVPAMGVAAAWTLQ